MTFGIKAGEGNKWIELELQFLAYTTITAIAMQDPSCICDLCLSLQQRQILNPPREAKDQTHIHMDTSQVLNPLSHNRSSYGLPLKRVFENICHIRACV